MFLRTDNNLLYSREEKCLHFVICYVMQNHLGMKRTMHIEHRGFELWNELKFYRCIILQNYNIFDVNVSRIQWNIYFLFIFNLTI